MRANKQIMYSYSNFYYIHPNEMYVIIIAAFLTLYISNYAAFLITSNQSAPERTKFLLKLQPKHPGNDVWDVAMERRDKKLLEQHSASSK